MNDVVDKATRSKMMSGIRGKNTRPEIALRRAMHAIGLRYRLHRNDLPGKPDIVMPGRKVVIFVHGCFWHQHEGCRFATTPRTRPEFWRDKFASNTRRDKRNVMQLLERGWRVATVWECALRKAGAPEAAARDISEWLVVDTDRHDIGINGSVK
jgi:DNA mismatch endonuclease (patch repair protein)